MIVMTDHPLDWYVAKLRSGEPFASLLYGDGEFAAMSGSVDGAAYTTYRERVTPRLRQELLASLDDPDPAIVRGSDFHILDWRRYGGRDVDAVRTASERASRVLASRNLEFADGTVWDAAVRDGKLSPLLQALHGRKVALVGNRRLVAAEFLHAALFVPVPDHDAAGALDELERRLLESRPAEVYVVCTGLGAIPLIMRLRRRRPEATFLDLGSVLDVFVGLGSERGWRRELYAEPARLLATVAVNLDGVCGQVCGQYRVQSAQAGCSYYVRFGRVEEG